MMIFDGRSASSRRTSGWERYTRALAERLTEARGVHVWTTDVGTLPRRIFSDLRAARLPRTAHVHFPTFPPISPARYSRLVLTVHDLTWWRYPETASRLGNLYYRPILQRALPHADAVVTHSSTVKHEVIEAFGIAEERVHVVFCGADSLPRIARDTDSEARKIDRPYLLVVGSVEPRKNLDRLAVAFRESRMGEDYDLIVVGRAAWGEVPSGVQLVQGVDDATLSDLYRNAVALILPSLYEGFGLPIVEALSSGTQVLCSDISVFREVAGDHAAYFDPLSIADMRDALRRIDPTRRVPNEVVRRIKETYTWNLAVERLVSIYDSL